MSELDFMEPTRLPQASALARESQQEPAPFSVRLRRARLGVVIAIVADTMIFAAYASAYIVRQGLPSLDDRSGTLVHDWLPLPLPGSLWITTMLLLASAVTMELARRKALRFFAAQSELTTSGSAELQWPIVTIVLGLSFLAGQWLAWRELSLRGFSIASNPSSSFFYLLSGMHGAHVLLGIVALAVASAAFQFKPRSQKWRIAMDATAWYWQFAAALWICLLALLEFAR